MDVELDELQHLLQKRKCYLGVMEILHENQLVVSLESLFLAGMYYLNMAFRENLLQRVWWGKNRSGEKI